MQPISLFEIVKQVFFSWQVIAITIVIIMYIFLVSYAARSYRRPRVKRIKMNMFKKKKSQSAAASGGPEEAVSSSNSNEELGLEEA